MMSAIPFVTISVIFSGSVKRPTPNTGFFATCFTKRVHGT